MGAVNEAVHAILLLGGGGTRLWPLSTDDHPKQFLPLFAGRSLFQLTLERIQSCKPASVRVVTNERYLEIARAQAAPVCSGLQFILEPARRDSAPAIAAGVAAIEAESGADAMVVVLPCDHLIPDHAAFAESIGDAVKTARSGPLVTFGIYPTSPSTEYGYIKQGVPLAGAPDAFRAEAFCEKPALETALSYIAAGDYFWNSGMFVFRTRDFVREARLHMLQVWTAAREAVSLAQQSSDVLRLHADSFGRAEKISIDYALFEKSGAVALLPRHFGWSDVGNWASVHAALPHDADGNAARGDAAIHESRNTLVYGDGVRVIALGLNDTIVIASPDGVFVAPASRAAEIKNLL